MLTSLGYLSGSLRLSAVSVVFSGYLLAQSPKSPAPTAVERQAESLRRMELSVAKQKAAVQRQAGGGRADEFFTAPWAGEPLFLPMPPPTADCDPIDAQDPDGVVAKAARGQNLDPAVLRAVIQQESGFQPCAVSPKGAVGLMQLMPETAEHFHVADPFNTEQNVAAGARYLKQLIDRFHGDLKLALAAYNAGPERVEGDPPAVPDIPETQNYVTQILKSLEKAK